jgi:ribonuclease HII
MERDMLIFEKMGAERGHLCVCGIDEAGRGPLAGPVFAAAVILPTGFDATGVDDSKKLSAAKREELFRRITEECRFAIAQANEKEIDRYNILQATYMAMRRALGELFPQPDLALVDGNGDPGLGISTWAIVGGDGRSVSIAAASILAKVARDRYMCELDRVYPQYGFARHKGYPTKAHYDSLRHFGSCPAHRRSFLKKWAEASGHVG